MQAMDDMALLREYATRNSETAFEALVSRRVGFVYSAALRQVRDPHLAEEVTQAVFIILAQKAGRISDKTMLAGWLFRTTRFAALAQMRADAKRRRREQEANMQSEIQPTAPDVFWEQLSPLLDEALASLGETDRQAVLLRFFENQSLAEVGSRLGTREDTARKRVSRALEKLRRYFSKRGVSSTTAIIAEAISANSAHAAPVGLATTITATVIKGPAVAASTLALVKGTLKVMTWIKLKIALGITAALLLAGGAMTVALSSDTSAGGGNLASVFQFRLVLNAPSAKADPMTVVQQGADAKAAQTLYIQKKVLLDQTDLMSASVITNQPAGKPRIQITFTDAGAKRFAKVTRQNIGKRLAIIIDGRLYSAPMIKSEIRGGQAEISGNFSEPEAQDLATKINQSVTK